MERLIESVREHSCLWKVDEEDYKNNEMKEAAWRKVIVECDILDVKEAKSMWKKLRDGHRQALSKKKTTTGQAAGSDKLWKYEKQMSFLVPHLANRQRSTNASIQASQWAETDESQENTRDAEDDSPWTKTNKEIEQTNYNYNSPLNKRKNDKLIEYLEHEQKRRDQKSVARDQLRQELLSMKRKEDTALKKFFDSMYEHTYSLPDHLQIKVQRKIFNTVMEAREEHIQHQTHHTNSSSATCEEFFEIPVFSPTDTSCSSGNLTYTQL